MQDLEDLRDDDLLCGSAAFERDRIRFQRGRLLSCHEVCEIAQLTPTELDERIARGDVAARDINRQTLVHEDDLAALCHLLWEEARGEAARLRVDTSVRRRHHRRQEWAVSGDWDLRVCPSCGTAVEARGPFPREVDEFEYWDGDLLSVCEHCGERTFFTRCSTPSATFDPDSMPF